MIYLLKDLNRLTSEINQLNKVMMLIVVLIIQQIINLKLIPTEIIHINLMILIILISHIIINNHKIKILNNINLNIQKSKFLDRQSKNSLKMYQKINQKEHGLW